MKRGAPDHPKVHKLMDELDIGHAQTIGHLELLWHFTAKYARQGDIGRWDDTRIAAACSWGGEPRRFVAAATKAGFLDRHKTYRLVVHNWHKHADQSVRKTLQNNKEAFVSFPEKDGTIPEKDGKVPSFSSLHSHAMPVPKPCHAIGMVEIPPAGLAGWLEGIGVTEPNKTKLLGAGLSPAVASEEWRASQGGATNPVCVFVKRCKDRLGIGKRTSGLKGTLNGELAKIQQANDTMLRRRAQA